MNLIEVVTIVMGLITLLGLIRTPHLIPFHWCLLVRSGYQVNLEISVDYFRDSHDS